MYQKVRRKLYKGITARTCATVPHNVGQIYHPLQEEM